MEGRTRESHKVVIHEGVTSIGKNAFAAEEENNSIVCDTFFAQYIDEGSCALDVVVLVIPESVEVIEKNAL